MNNPSRPLRVMLVTTPFGSRARPMCDPAIDLAADGVAAALSRYERERTDEAREAVPLKAGAVPVLFTLTALSMKAATIVTDTDGETAAVAITLAVACHRYTDALGVEHKAADFGEVKAIDKSTAIAPDAWVEHLHETFGLASLRELAKVVSDRSNAGARELVPFQSPRGLTLPL